MELRPIAPHMEQDHRQFARNGGSSLFHSGTLGKAKTPCLERPPFLDARQQDAGGFEQVSA
jgi:hypothetical protein